MKKISVGILGATGTVGQRFVQLLEDHPWFEVTALVASDRSAGQPYAEACHWLLPVPMPAAARELVVQSCEPNLACQLVFSALPSDIAFSVEEAFARAGYVVCSNASAHRMDEDVPLLIPEVNASHTALIPYQRQRREWEGLMVTSPNCSTTQLALALKPLHGAFGLRKVSVVTLQAVSGAGYPGVPSLDILDNVIPFIGGEEEKMAREPRKLLGELEEHAISAAPFAVSAQCNRVPVREGHTECVTVAFERQPTLDDVREAFMGFRASPGVAELPSTPARPLQVHQVPDRPQPVCDRDWGGGMVVHVGRLRPCEVLDFKFVVLGHNTLRGAAGGAIHNAELLVKQGWI